ncbi:MAG: hypothetical protein JSV16_14930 [Candidatus Hydrogenedentota bacterium]|nr:MAG: hypothetical protein JSV16_14930 [Candidatus Hydrogenedentota bacterium]
MAKKLPLFDIRVVTPVGGLNGNLLIIKTLQKIKRRITFQVMKLDLGKCTFAHNLEHSIHDKGYAHTAQTNLDPKHYSYSIFESDADWSHFAVALFRAWSALARQYYSHSTNRRPFTGNDVNAQGACMKVMLTRKP